MAARVIPRTRNQAQAIAFSEPKRTDAADADVKPWSQHVRTALHPIRLT